MGEKMIKHNNGDVSDKEIKTSPIRIRPWKPCLRDEDKLGREPFATISFGNVVMEVDCTFFRFLTFDVESMFYDKAKATGDAGLGEIVKEMSASLYQEIPSNHRDNMKDKMSISDYPLHPINEEVDWDTDNLSTLKCVEYKYDD